MGRRVMLLIVPLLVLSLLGSACGGDDEAGETEPSGEATTLQLAADPGGALSFDKDTLQAPAGTVTIELANESSTPHNVAIEGGGVDEESPTVTGEPTELTVDLEPATYTFYCSVAGHREGGMEGTLTVG
jgi:plastocyanin